MGTQLGKRGLQRAALVYMALHPCGQGQGNKTRAVSKCHVSRLKKRVLGISPVGSISKSLSLQTGFWGAVTVERPTMMRSIVLHLLSGCIPAKGNLTQIWTGDSTKFSQFQNQHL